MSVSKKSEGQGLSDQRSKGIPHRDHILIFIVGRAVDQLDLGKLLQALWTLGKRAEPVEVAGSELIARPDGGSGGHRVEIVEGDETRSCFVVVATDKNLSQATGAVSDFVRTGAVADDVAEIGHEIERRSRGETGFQSF